MKKNFSSRQDTESTDSNSELANAERREALLKIGKYTPPLMVALLMNDHAWAQTSGGGIVGGL